MNQAQGRQGGEDGAGGGQQSAGAASESDARSPTGPAARTDPHQASRACQRWMLAALLLVCAVPLSKNQPDPDFWGHVQYGRDALAGGLPVTITYSYTAPGHRWINHEVVSELLLAGGVDLLGPAGLLWIKCLLGVMLIGAVIGRAMAARVSQLAVALLALLVAINLMHFWLLRPQLASYLLFAVMIGLLDWAFAGWHGRWRLSRPRLAALGALPPLFAFWACTHGGFVAGFAVLTAYLVCRGSQAVFHRGPAAALGLACFALVVVVTGLATLLNPHGAQLHGWLWQSLLTPRPEIVEWRAPELGNLAWLPWWVLVLLFCAAAGFTRRRRDLAQTIILLLVLWQALSHQRHIPFFTILFGLWYAGHVDDLLRRLGLGRRGAAVESGAARRAQGAFLLALAGVCLVAATTLTTQLATMPVPRCRYPVSAFQYLADENLSGRLVVRFMWAQYAIAAFAARPAGEARSQVAFDGRFRTCYPQTVVDMYFDFAYGDRPGQPRHRSPASGPIDATRILDFGRPDLVLLDRNQPHTLGVLRGQRGRWVLLYQDALTQLWGRAAKYDDPAGPHYVPPHRRRISQQTQTGWVAWPALPQPPAAAAVTNKTLRRQGRQPNRERASLWYAPVGRSTNICAACAQVTN